MTGTTREGGRTAKRGSALWKRLGWEPSHTSREREREREEEAGKGDGERRACQLGRGSPVLALLKLHHKNSPRRTSSIHDGAVRRVSASLAPLFSLFTFHFLYLKCELFTSIVSFSMRLRSLSEAARERACAGRAARTARTTPS